MDKIAVLIPCYNESKTIEKVIKDFKKELPDAVIYVYDNNSVDGTDKIAKENGAIVRYEKKQGKGNVIRTMFREIEAQCYLMVDGDDTYPAEIAREMCNSVLRDNADMVVGDRLSSTYFKENKRPFHNFGNILVRKLINKIYKTKIRDVMTGYRAFSYRFVKTFPVISKGFEIETEMTIHSLDKNLNISNIIVEYRDRPQGSSSKLNTYIDGIRVIKTIVKLYKNYKPFSFFNYITTLFVALGTLFFIPLLIEYIKTGLVPRIPTLIVAMFFYLFSILSFFSGIILQTIVDKSKQEYEIKLNEWEDRFCEKMSEKDENIMNENIKDI